jgi:ketosteroid isomerase-like protein
MDLASIPGASTPSTAIWELAMRASAAWSSQDPEGVAACYEETASLTINNGAPATGRAELAATAAGYMAAFPDLQVTLDHLHVAGDSVFWVWTLTGTNNGPDGTGNAVRVSGIEVWRIGASGLVASSTGYYDAATYERQVANGIDASQIRVLVGAGAPPTQVLVVAR